MTCQNNNEQDLCLDEKEYNLRGSQRQTLGMTVVFKFPDPTRYGKLTPTSENLK